MLSRNDNLIINSQNVDLYKSRNAMCYITFLEVGNSFCFVFSFVYRIRLVS